MTASNLLLPASSVLICPVCKKPIVQDTSTYRCINTPSHAFDKSRVGYINLLLCHKKHSQDPGDNLEMVKSRRDFLAKGHYLPMGKLLGEYLEIKSKTFSSSPLHIADIGCGEGYMINRIKNILNVQGDSKNQYFGIDISKAAIQEAAKTKKGIEWVVANSSELPIASQSIDMAISTFAPFTAFPEIHRIIKKEGFFFVMTPAAEHLYQLREILFGQVIPIEARKVLPAAAPYFILEEEIPLHYTVHLPNSQEVSDLFKMTPFYWKCKSEKQAEVLALQSLTLTIAINLWIFTPIFK